MRRPHGWAHRPGRLRGRYMRRLQVRLLVWFLSAIALAIGASAIVTWATASEPIDTPARVFSRHVQRRVAREWDDVAATEAYVAQLREDTGLDVRIRRDPSVLSLARRAPRGAGGIFFEEGVAYLPVVRNGTTVGALELRTPAQRPAPWRVAIAIVAAIFALGFLARRVSKRLANPLEHLASTAERFGAGDLEARTGMDKLPARWVAEEVRDVSRAFDTMADRISRVVLEQRELLAAISHELRSPLGRARIALEIARERAPNEAARPLGDVETQLVEVDVILGDLLASARAGLADVRPETIVLATWLVERAAGESQGPIDVSVDPSVKDARVAVDVGLLGRALHNVFANAWAHGHPKEERLVVTMTRAPASAGAAGDARVRVAVRDRGPGFPGELLPRAFEPFVTGTGPARSPGAHGIGLGLALVRRIVEAHGGRVSASNVEGGGAEVAFDLPLAEN